jgi:hypothetical protein
MRRKLGIIILLVGAVLKMQAQHLIGLSKNEVIKQMKETSFVIDNTSRNTTFKYLKYVDKFEEKTLLVFLSKDDMCTSTKMMSDYSSYRATVNEFNAKYKKVAANEWNYIVDTTIYKVTLKKEEWYFSVFVTTKTD